MTTTLFQLKKNNQIRFMIKTTQTNVVNKKTEYLTALSNSLMEIINEKKATLSYDVVYNYVNNLCYASEQTIIQQISRIVDSSLQQLAQITKQALVLNESLESLETQYLIFSKKLMLMNNILLSFDRITNDEPLVKKAYTLFRTTVIGNAFPQIITSLIQLINALRTENISNYATHSTSRIVRNVIRMINDCNVQDDFKTELLSTTSTYYGDQCAVTMNSPLENYLFGVKLMLEKEEKIADIHYPLFKVDTLAFVEKELIIEALPLITLVKKTQIKEFISAQKTETLILFITLCIRAKKENDLTKSLVEAIVAIGNEYCNYKPTKGENGELAKMNKIFTLYNYLSAIEKQQPILTSIIKMSFEKFISAANKDISVAIVKFTDKLLRKEQMSEEWANKILQIFKFLSSKDVFEHYYQLLLSKRLLFKSFYHEGEHLVLKRLKEECGNSYTTKLDDMVKDVEIGREWYEELNGFLHKKGMTSQYGMVVINSVSWPVCPSIKCKEIPQQISQAEELMRGWYLKKHQRKRVDFNEILSIVSVRMECFGNLDISLNVLQLEILVLCDNKTIKQMKELFEGDDDVLLTQLKALMMKEKLILLKNNPTAQITKETVLNDNDVVIFNTEYKPTKPKIKLYAFQTRENKVEKEKVYLKVVKDRESRIDAFIVKKMKKEKRKTRDEIVKITMTSLDFNPTAEEINQRIDKLIDREYLEADQNNADMLNYVA